VNDQADQSVGGDADSWLLFERCTEAGYPLVVLARIGNPLVEEAIDQALMTIVRCQADPEIVNDSGMPQHTDRVYSLEDTLARELDAFGVEAMHVASVTGDGARCLVYVHLAPLDFKPLLESHPVPGYSLSAVSPGDRSALTALITPSALDRQLSGDRGVISNLEELGDDGSQPRRTDFWFYGERSALTAVAAELAPWGFTISHYTEDGDGVVLYTETATDLDTFRELTPVLIGIAEKYFVTYDGWETFVVRAGAPAPEPEQRPQTKSLFSRLFGGKKN
jgi:regulator of RNase E activity RraB